jgi:hypothetical protein
MMDITIYLCTLIIAAAIIAGAFKIADAIEKLKEK